MGRLLKKASIICCLLTQTFAQDMSVLVLRAGTLSFSVNAATGHFGLLDTTQRNIDLASVLFGGAFPSSHIVITVDGVSFTLSELQAEYPLALTLGSQIDGIYKIDDLVFETAFFAMNYGQSTEPNTVGGALRITNASRGRPRVVSVKYLLDTDISEARNRSMLFLPSGNSVTNALLLPHDNLPPYLFFGEKDPARQFAQGKGYYLYPNLSTNIPSAVVIANWKRIHNQDWIPKIIEPALKDDTTGVVDIGVALYYGEYVINPGEFQDIGFAISKEKSVVQPIVEQQALTKGVFDSGRFNMSEIFQPQNVTPNNQMPSLIPQPFQKKKADPKTECISSCSDFPYNDSVWRQTMDLNFRIDQKHKKIQEALQ